MHKKAKLASESRSGARARYVTIRGKRIKTTPRGERIFRAVTRALKGVEVPPR